ncbi:TrfA family protein [Burkholderia pseudomallei]|uniref:plasmid replication initiator TrfA n=1 Tax=Burkholderia pseudomallei TaxID=28450 RepID=UPI000F1BC265|nr:plasmid replication initiator TrfA [Burkholderia pseudomallei]CAJ7236065.1 TrfA family protein [Burkholderia pseudomallei]VBC15544.1 TrfA family protein [Burkholderia pseudomallei]VBS98857.1 TrfA family protein [Burkholderia pseudomallei]
MLLTSLEKAYRRTYYREQVAQGVAPREAASIAAERAKSAATASWLLTLEEPPQPPDWFESPEERAARLEKVQAADDVQLATAKCAPEPLTPDHPGTTVVVPHEFVRCGLFGVADPKTPRKQEVNDVFKIYGTNGGTISYHGPELRQDDRQVFFEALHLERSTPGAAIATPHQFLVNLGWSRNTEARNKLRGCLERLQDAHVTVEVSRLGKLVIPQLLTAVEVLDGGSYRVKFNDDVRKLYDGNHYTQLKREYEKKLERRSDLARWLMLFYSTHQTPNPIPLVVLRKLCNDRNDRPDNYAFKEKMVAALAQLARVGFLLEWGITKKVEGRSGTEMVTVKRPRVRRSRRLKTEQ